jgi:hypothetical protein
VVHDIAMALPLVQFDDAGGCRVCPEGIACLRAITTPVAVVAVAGRYRTGKSYLLNHVLLQRPQGFPVGPTTQPCTKGLWLWPDAVHESVCADGRPCHVLVIDTEGTGATNSNDTRDTRIFALALLLSSYFIYNSQGSIDEPALASLQVVTHVSEMVSVKAAAVAPWNTDAPTLAHFFPTFLWVVRDFVLELRSESGSVLEESEYLEEALRCTGGAKDEVRQAILAAFPHRDCATLVRPCSDESKLRMLDQLPATELRAEFVEQTQKLRAKALAAPPKTMHGQAVTGAMLATLCECYTQAIADGGAPVIETAWTYVCVDQCRRGAKTALATFTAVLAADTARTPMGFGAAVQQARTSALEQYAATAVGDAAAEERERLVHDLDRAADGAMTSVLAAWDAKCTVPWTCTAATVSEIVEAWHGAMAPPTTEHPHEDAYLHAARLAANLGELRRALVQHTEAAEQQLRDLQREHTAVLGQQLERQTAHQEALEIAQAAAARQTEAAEALTLQLAEAEGKHADALAAVQNTLEDERTQAQAAMSSSMAELRSDLERAAAERQAEVQAMVQEQQAAQQHSSAEALAQLQEEHQTQAHELARAQACVTELEGEQAAWADCQRQVDELQQQLAVQETALGTARKEQAAHIAELVETWEAQQRQKEKSTQSVHAQLQQAVHDAEEQARQETVRAEDLVRGAQRLKEELAAKAAQLQRVEAKAQEQTTRLQQQLALQKEAQATALAEQRAEHMRQMGERHEADKVQLRTETDLRAELQQLRAEAQIRKIAEGAMASQVTEHQASLKRKRGEISQLKADHKESEKERAKAQRGYDRHAALQTEHTTLQQRFQQLQHQHSKVQAASLVEHNKLEIRGGMQQERAKELEAEQTHLKSQLAKQTAEVARYKKVFADMSST